MAVVFAVAMLSGVVGNVGVVKTQAATYLGTIGQTDFDKSCMARTWGNQTYTTKYNFKTYLCEYQGTIGKAAETDFGINWDEVCRDKYDKNKNLFPWQRAYSNWLKCYRN